MEVPKAIADIAEVKNLLKALTTGTRSDRRVGGRFQPLESGNRFIAKGVIRVQPVPGDRHAQFWVTYSGLRETNLRLMEDPNTSELVRKTLHPDALNGYVCFEKRHAPHVERSNLVKFIPVHGGVTYARKDSYAAVWGFDTMHGGSHLEPYTDQDWILGNCFVLYRGLKLVEKLLPEFKRAGQARRTELAQQVLELIGEQPLGKKLGIEAMVSVLTGRI